MPLSGSGSNHLFEVSVFIYVMAPNASRALKLVDDLAREVKRRKVVESVAVGLAQPVRGEPPT